MNEPQTIDEMLAKTKTIAVVGLSKNPGRASFGVSHYMQRNGYKIIPVNPQCKEVLGEISYPSLDDAVEAVGKIDMVDVFRSPGFVPEIVKDVIRLKIPYLWLQEGVVHDEAAGWAEAAGVKVVMDRCLYKEHAHAGL
jgi:predicted CoA-binding protein